MLGLNRSCLFLLCLLTVVFCAKGFTIKDLMKDVADYDKKDAPENSNGYPVKVSVQIGIKRLGPINEKTFTYEIDYYARMWWVDPRIIKNNTKGVKEIKLNSDPHEYLWTPTLSYVNAIKTTNFENVRSIIKTNGEIYLVRRVQALMSCRMNLRFYPMDQQTCPFEIEDFSLSNNSLRYDWHDKNPFFINNDVEIPGYTFEKIIPSKSTVKYVVGGEKEYFDRLVLHIRVQRSFNYFLFRIYIPSILLVMFNLASYWVPDGAVPARVGLIVTTFLTNTLILQSVTEQTVQVPYTSSMQIFLLGSIFLLMMSIVEYLVVLYCNERAKNRKKKLMSPGGPNSKPAPVTNTNETFTYGATEKPAKGDVQLEMKPTLVKKDRQPLLSSFVPHFVAPADNAHILDRIARFVVPFSYALFCLVYFWYFFGTDQTELSFDNSF